MKMFLVYSSLDELIPISLAAEMTLDTLFQWSWSALLHCMKQITATVFSMFIAIDCFNQK